MRVCSLTMFQDDRRDGENQGTLDGDDNGSRVLVFLSLAVRAAHYCRSGFESVVKDDCKWCYISQIAIVMIANGQTRKPHPQS